MQQQNGDDKKGKIIMFLAKNENWRVFILQGTACVFLIYICSNLAYALPFQGHPHDKNFYVLVYVALVVYSIICFIGSITGAHINPAISLSFFLDKKKKTKKAIKTTLVYIAAQCLGCTIGGLLSYGIQGQMHSVYSIMPETLGFIKDFFEELITTFIFITFIYIVTNEDTTFVYEEAWVHLSIGIAYYFCLTFSRLSILNPAVAFGVQLSAFMVLGNIQAQCFLPTFGLMMAQFIAGILSQLFFKHVYRSFMVDWKRKIGDDQ